jgi:hypothetical protein
MVVETITGRYNTNTCWNEGAAQTPIGKEFGLASMSENGG